jgi:hypothetical protein
MLICEARRAELTIIDGPLYNLRLPDEIWSHPMIKEAEDAATVITFLCVIVTHLLHQARYIALTMY